jgi:PPOX class probable F420-dependent enzyme
MTADLPESHADLLERPLFAHLATIRPDGSPQSSVMWFAWDGQRVRFSHTSTRQKYHNLLADGRVAFHVQDPENAYRTLEVRGQVESMDPDTDATFYRGAHKVCVRIRGFNRARDSCTDRLTGTARRGRLIPITTAAGISPVPNPIQTCGAYRCRRSRVIYYLKSVPAN